jgi:hypothetical protein
MSLECIHIRIIHMSENSEISNSERPFILWLLSDSSLSNIICYNSLNLGAIHKLATFPNGLNEVCPHGLRQKSVFSSDGNQSTRLCVCLDDLT